MKSVFVARQVGRYWEAQRDFIETDTTEAGRDGDPKCYASGRTYEECLREIAKIPKHRQN